MTGIYTITNLNNNKKYVGSSTNIDRRFKEHQSDLRCRTHHNPYLQKSYDKYGCSFFVYDIVELCNRSFLIPKEELWIARLNTTDQQFGYNLSPFPSRPRLGRKASPETLLKMSKANGGVNHPMYGRKHSLSHCINMSIAQKGIKKPTSGRKKEFHIISPEGEAVVFLGLRAFCRQHSLNVSAIHKVARGQRAEYRGWRPALAIQERKK